MTCKNRKKNNQIDQKEPERERESDWKDERKKEEEEEEANHAPAPRFNRDPTAIKTRARDLQRKSQFIKRSDKHDVNFIPPPFPSFLPAH